MTRNSNSPATDSQTFPHVSRLALTLCLILIFVVSLGGCRLAEQVVHDTGRSLHGSSGYVFTAKGECTTERGNHRIVVNGARGQQATEEMLYEENLDTREFAGVTMPAEHTAIYTLKRTSGERTEVKIESEQLTVNGKTYGTLKHGDAVTIDGDKFFINTQEAPQLASN